MKTQKRFLDVISEETAKGKGKAEDGARKMKKTEVAELARAGDRVVHRGAEEA